MLTEAPSRTAAVLASALFLLILVMRGPITCVGVIAEPVMQAFEIGYAAFGFLCALPIACFGVCGFCAPMVSGRFGLSQSLTLAAVLVFLGALGRLVPDYSVLLLSTVLVATGIAFLNVLMPVLLKQTFPKRIDVTMGFFTGFIGLSGAIGTYVSVPLWERFGTVAAPFGFWAVLGAAALLLWCLAPKKGSAGATRFAIPKGFLANPMTWAVTLVMGLQSLTIYTTAAWLPTVLQTKGFSASDAGLGVAAFLLISAPASILLPVILRVFRGGRNTAIFCAVEFAAGLLLWLTGGAGSIVGCLLAGISQGLAFSLALLVMSEKSHRLSNLFLISGFAQGVGYVGAGFGPWLCGVFFEASHDARVIVGFLFAAVVVWGVSAWYAFGPKPLFAGEKP